MKYFHCPTTYRSKPYGCGRGPYNATQAMLDRWGTCACGKKLVPYTPPKVPRVTNLEGDAVTCKATGMAGERYCNAPAVEGVYCRRHAYVNHSTGA